MKCDRGGNYQNGRNLTEAMRLRTTRSHLTGCKFKLLGRKDFVLGDWWLTVRYPHHNHPAPSLMVAHTRLRKLNAAATAPLKTMSAAIVLPQTIGAILEQNGHANTVVMKDLYNARQRLRNLGFDSRTPIQAPVEQMQSDNLYWNVKHDERGHVTHLLFAYKKLLEMYQSYPDVLLMD
jgi:hypothetical protein